MFNVVSTCSYGNTLDAVQIKSKWEEKEKELKEKYNKQELIKIKKRIRFFCLLPISLSGTFF